MPRKKKPFTGSIYTAGTTLKQYDYNTQVVRDLPVFCGKGGLYHEHLSTCLQVINEALEYHPRTLAIRVDLRLPGFMDQLPDDAISGFIEAFKYNIKQDRLSVARVQRYAKPCKVHYIWARECDHAWIDHFHVLLLLNQDAYPSLGSFSSENKNLANRIKESWALALDIDMDQLGGSVHFPKNGEYVVNASAEPDDRLLRLIESEEWLEMDKDERYDALTWFNDCYEGLFYRASYLCKVNTKVSGRAVKSFRSSHLRR